MGLCIALAHPAAAQQKTRESTINQDLNNYATSVAGYAMDGKCQVLTPAQRKEYFSHLKIMEHVFKILGVDTDILERISQETELNIKESTSLVCDAETAGTIRQIAVLTHNLGTTLADWLVDTGRAKPKTPN